MGNDDFEEAEMHDGAPIVHRDKLVSRRMAGLFMASGIWPIVVAVFIAVKNASSQKPIPAGALPVVVGLVAALGIAMCVAGVVFGVLRTVVTKRAVHVKYGLWGPTIPLEAITSVRAVDYDWTEFGGWGIKLGRNGSRAYVPGPKSGPVLELVYRDRGKSKRVLVGAEDAAATVAAIERERAGGGARVATSDDAALAAESEEHEEPASAKAARR